MNEVPQLLTTLFVQELPNLSDETDALRRALLACLLVMEDDGAAVRTLREFLLTEFRPLADSFVEHKHPLLHDIDCMRGRDSNDVVQLFLPEGLTKDLIERTGKLRFLPVTDTEVLDDFIKAFNLPTELDYDIAQELLRLIAQGHNIENAVAAIQGVDAIHGDGID